VFAALYVNLRAREKFVDRTKTFEGVFNATLGTQRESSPMWF